MPNESAVMPGSAPVEPDLKVPDGAAYDEWRKTGKLPDEDSAPHDKDKDEKEEVEEKPEKSEIEQSLPGDEEESASSEEVEPSVSAGSEPAKPQGKRDARIKELLAERKKGQLALEEANRRIAELSAPRKQESQPAPEAPKPAAPSKLRAEPKIDDVKADGKTPKYATWEEYHADVRAWDKEALRAEMGSREDILKEAQGRFETTSEQREKQARFAEAKRILDEGWTKRVGEAVQKHPDFAEVAFAKDPKGGDLMHIPEGSVGDYFMRSSELGTEVLYYLGKHPDEAKRIFAFTPGPQGKHTYLLDPYAQHRALIEIEQKVKPSTSPTTPPAKPVTRAPAPPHQVSGKATPSVDDVEQAVNEGDFESYSAAANRRDIARRKRG